MIAVTYTNIQSKTKKMVSYLNLLPLYEKLSKCVRSHMLYTTVVEIPAIFIDADTRMKGVQI